LVAAVIAARTLGPTIGGSLVYLTWISDTAATVAALGLPSTITRFTAALNGEEREDEAGALVRRLYAVQLSSAVCGALLLVIVARLSRSATSGAVWLSISLAFLLQTAGAFYTAYLAGVQRFKQTARLNAISGILLVTGVLCGACRFGLIGAVWGYAAGALPAALASVRLAIPARSDVRLRRDLRRRIFRYSLFAWASTLITAMIWSRMEIYFLKRYWTADAVAMFTVGITLSSLAAQGPLLLSGAMFSHFAGLAGTRDWAALHATYASATRRLALLLFPACLGLASITPTLLPMVYGEAYRPAVPTAMVLIAFAALSFATIGSSLIYGMEKAWFIAAGGLGGAALSLTASMIVIPHYGVWGAVWSRAAVQTAMVALGLWFISRKLLCAVPLWALTKTLLAASLAALAAYAATTIHRGLAGLGLALIASPLLYALLAILFGLVESSDWRRLRLAAGNLSSFRARSGGSIA